jgi:hypothetical protein
MVTVSIPATSLDPIDQGEVVVEQVGAQHGAMVAAVSS